jgi:dihydrofolate reductase
MGNLIYLMNVSLDGFIETPDRSLDWTMIDEELHTWFNDRQRTLGASFYGRRLYELMNAYWPTAESDPDATPAMLEYAVLWRQTPKIVFSSTLHSVEGNARHATGTVEEEVARARAEHEGDLEVGGPTLGAEFIRRGLVDVYQLVVHPVVIGGGTPFFPRDVSLRLRLTETVRFGSGVLALTYVPAG